MVTTIDLTRGDTELIIAKCKELGVLRNQCAYILATAYHETAHTMKPVKEYGSTKYLRAKPYWPWIGRGYVQLTHKGNYRFVGQKIGVDLIADPDAALVAKNAVVILVRGMLEGWFSAAHPLVKYVNLTKSDYFNARRGVNILDRAADIAEIAKDYEKLLLAAGYGVDKLPRPIDAPVALMSLNEYDRTSLWGRVKRWFA